LLVDDSPEAVAVMARRFARIGGVEYMGFNPRASDFTSP
jgi:hypothetical protein